MVAPTTIDPNALAKLLSKSLDRPANYYGPYGEDRWLQRLESVVKAGLEKQKPRSRKRKRK